MYGALESVAMLWHLRSYRDIIIIIVIILMSQTEYAAHCIIPRDTTKRIGRPQVSLKRAGPWNVILLPFGALTSFVG